MCGWSMTGGSGSLGRLEIGVCLWVVGLLLFRCGFLASVVCRLSNMLGGLPGNLGMGELGSRSSVCVCWIYKFYNGDKETDTPCYISRAPTRVPGMCRLFIVWGVKAQKPVTADIAQSGVRH